MRRTRRCCGFKAEQQRLRCCSCPPVTAQSNQMVSSSSSSSQSSASVRVCVTVQGETEGGNGGRGGGLPLLSIFLCLARLLPVPDTGIARELAICAVVKQSIDICRSCMCKSIHMNFQVFGLHGVAPISHSADRNACGFTQFSQNQAFFLCKTLLGSI